MIAVFLIFLILTFIFLVIGLSDFLKVMGKQLRELTLSCSSDTDSTTIEGGGKSDHQHVVLESNLISQCFLQVHLTNSSTWVFV